MNDEEVMLLNPWLQAIVVVVVVVGKLLLNELDDE